MNQPFSHSSRQISKFCHFLDRSHQAVCKTGIFVTGQGGEKSVTQLLLCTNDLFCSEVFSYCVTLKKILMYKWIMWRRKKHTHCVQKPYHKFGAALSVSITTNTCLCLPDLWDDLQHGTVLRDPQQPCILKHQTTVPTCDEGRTSWQSPPHSFTFILYAGTVTYIACWI